MAHQHNPRATYQAAQTAPAYFIQVAAAAPVARRGVLAKLATHLNIINKRS